MGSVVKAVGGALGLGGGGGAGPKLNTRLFDTRKQVEERVKPAREATLGLVQQLQQQSQGQGPSLATAQLKAAQDRNLSQLLAAASAQRGGSAAARQRQISQTQSDMGRQLAQEGAQARLQEQQQAQQLLANVGLQQQGQDLSQVLQPANLLAQGEQTRFQGDVARRQAVQAQQSAMLGSLLGAGGQVLGGYVSGKAEGGIIGSPESEARESFLRAVQEAAAQQFVADRQAKSQASNVAAALQQRQLSPGAAISAQEAAMLPRSRSALVGPGILTDAERKRVNNAQRFVGPGILTDAERRAMDHTSNDTIPAVLSAGEMVVPKTVVSAGPDAVKSFAEAVMSKQQRPAEAVGGFGALIQAQQELADRLKKLERKKGK